MRQLTDMESDQRRLLFSGLLMPCRPPKVHHTWPGQTAPLRSSGPTADALKLHHPGHRHFVIASILRTAAKLLPSSVAVQYWRHEQARYRR